MSRIRDPKYYNTCLAIYSLQMIIEKNDLSSKAARKTWSWLRVLVLLSSLVVLASCAQDSPSSPVTPAAETPEAEVTVEPEDDNGTLAAVPATLPAQPTAEPTTAEEAQASPEAQETADAPPSGAIIEVSMHSRVGVLLDEFPVAIRDRVAAEILAQPDEYWLARAEQQIDLTKNRLNFRDYVYDDKGQLPLPPRELWTISLDTGGPRRETIQGHDLVLIDYSLSSTLLTDLESPAVSEPELGEIGGVWEEPFVFPADPHMLLQRTDNACVNEGGYPPNSYDSENIAVFYDYTCEADSGGALGCHRIRLPNFSCREALEARVGEVETAVRFERVDWDSTLADEVRVGTVPDIDAPDLLAVSEDLGENRIVYRYIGPDNCALEENAVGSTGWRRLLQFSATAYNVGDQPLEVGPVVAEDPENHMFVYNACHDHFHYTNYGDFVLEAAEQTQGSKQAFCVQSTSRYSNNELTPLVHDYSCIFQGIQTGWVDEYVAGLDVQWIDITDLDIPDEGTTLPLVFNSNSDEFLCEGTPVLDENGDPVWEPTGFTLEDGHSLNRPQCDSIPDWDANNRASIDVFIPAEGGFVTEPCTVGEFSPLRNCGFEELLDDDLTCTPGQTVERTFQVQEPAEVQVLRVCEASSVLGTGTACAYSDSLANVLVGAEPTAVNFVCPAARDAEEPGGAFTLYTAPLLPAEAPQAAVPVTN